LKSLINYTLIVFCFLIGNELSAQNLSTTLTPIDTLRKIEIISANSLRQITINNTTVLETLAGKAKVKQGNTILEGDSIVLDKALGIAEVFGHVHINDADTVNTYAQYLRYMGNEQVAYLQKDVQLTDGKASLFTQDLVYDLKTGVATYKNGGKVVNGKTTLTSKDAVYYSDTKDVFFRNAVHLTDPNNNMVADSLRYNTAFKNAYFISQTHIVSQNGTIDTKSGTYNLETGEAVFLDKTIFRDSSRFVSGNKVAIDNKTNIIQIEDNGKFVDSANKVMVLGNQILIDKKNGSFLATRKPVMIFYKDKDSTFISADTLFSGKRIKDSSEYKKDSVSQQLIKNKTKNAADSVRYFLGFHHVKIYNDSIQAVCDSVHFSSVDSIFKLFKHPVCWNGNTQLSGDTMYLHTKNQQPEKVDIFYNAMLINKTTENIFNQMSGKTMNGFFVDGKIEYIRTRGNPAESIFYPQDDDSAYIGMNRTKGDVIDVFFENNEIKKVKVVNDVSGTLYPMKQIPNEQKRLKLFNWQDSIRPKSKLAIFE